MQSQLRIQTYEKTQDLETPPQFLPMPSEVTRVLYESGNPSPGAALFVSLTSTALVSSPVWTPIVIAWAGYRAVQSSICAFNAEVDNAASASEGAENGRGGDGSTAMTNTGAEGSR